MTFFINKYALFDNLGQNSLSAFAFWQIHKHSLPDLDDYH